MDQSLTHSHTPLIPPSSGHSDLAQIQRKYSNQSEFQNSYMEIPSGGEQIMPLLEICFDGGRPHSFIFTNGSPILHFEFPAINQPINDKFIKIYQPYTFGEKNEFTGKDSYMFDKKKMPKGSQRDIS